MMPLATNFLIERYEPIIPVEKQGKDWHNYRLHGILQYVAIADDLRRGNQTCDPATLTTNSIYTSWDLS